MMAITDYSGDREYGIVAQEEQQATDLEAAAAAAAQESAEMAAIAQPQGAPPQPGGRNMMKVLPPNVLFRTQREQQNPVTEEMGVGLLWRALASSPTAPEITRIIAARILGEG